MTSAKILEFQLSVIAELSDKIFKNSYCSEIVVVLKFIVIDVAIWWDANHMLCANTTAVTLIKILNNSN